MSKRRFRPEVLIPITYLMGCIPVWLGFATAPSAGLANIWVVVYTLPVVLIGSGLLSLDFPYFPGSYYTAHNIYFVCASVMIASGLYFVTKDSRTRIAERKR